MLKYHGGTNFGRTGAAFATTRYYDEAQLDEYGTSYSNNMRIQKIYPN